jgi:hypothetical protein
LCDDSRKQDFPAVLRKRGRFVAGTQTFREHVQSRGHFGGCPAIARRQFSSRDLGREVSGKVPSNQRSRTRCNGRGSQGA